MGSEDIQRAHGLAGTPRTEVPEISRRAFMRYAGLAVGLAGVGGGAACARTEAERDASASDAPDASSSGRPDQLGSFDLHSHPGDFYERGTPGYAGDEAWSDHMEAALDAGVTGAFVALLGDAAILRMDPQQGPQVERRFEPGEAWSDYKRQIADLHELLEGPEARLATETPAGGPEAVSGRQLAAFIACEGGDMLEGRADRIQEVYQDGVRSIQLVHYAQNELGDLQTEPPRYGGLSDSGREVVGRMAELGMVVDVAHASFETVQDVVEVGTGPITLSHSLLKDEGVHPGLLPRLITPDHARLVAETGGVIGVWPLGVYDPDGQISMQAYVDATLRLIDVVGVDHVGYSTDMGTMPMPIREYTELGRWKAGLIDGGLSAEEASRVTGGNAWRVLSRVLD